MNNKTYDKDYNDLLKETIINYINFYTFKDSDLVVIKDSIRNIRKKNYGQVIDDMLDLKALQVFEILRDTKVINK